MRPSCILDTKSRVVSIDVLKAMCDHISGTCHRFSVDEPKSTARFVKVYYSNPDEYGNDHPVAACYPIFNHRMFSAVETLVVLHAARYVGCKDEEWQAFDQLLDCEHMVYNNGEWLTEFQNLVARFPEWAVTSTWDKDGCIQTWHCHGQDFRGWREAEDWAVEEMKKEWDKKMLARKAQP